MVALDQTVYLNFSADFDGRGRAFYFEVFNKRHIIAIGQRVAVGIAHLNLIRVLRFVVPLVGAFRAYPEGAIGINILALAKGAGWDNRAHTVWCAWCMERNYTLCAGFRLSVNDQQT